MPPAAPRRRITRAELLLLLFSTGVALTATVLGAEWAIRHRERTRETVPGTMAQLFYRHSRLGHALVRNTSYFDWVHTNAQGFRGVRPTPVAAEPSTVRLFAVGGSTTFDSFVSHDSAAWPAVLERELQRLAPGTRLEIVNAGVPGFTVTQDLIRLQTELLAFQPDAILFLQGHNDLFGLLAPIPAMPTSDRPGAVEPFSALTLWLETHSLLYSKMIGYLDVVRFQRSGTPASTSAPVEDGTARNARAMTRFSEHVRSYLAVTSAHGIPTFVIEPAHVSGLDATEPATPAQANAWRGAVPFASTSTVLAGYRSFRDVMVAAAADHGATFVPTSQLAVTGDEHYVSGDPIHFSDAGARRFASGLAPLLLADSSFRRLLEAPPSDTSPTP